MVVKHPCTKCHKAVAKNDRAVQCDVCDAWIHIRCNGISERTYEILKNDEEPFICIICIQENLPFGNENNDSLYLTTMKGLNVDTTELNNIDICLDKKNLIKHITNLIIQNSTDPENNNTNFCKYYNIENFAKSRFGLKNSLSILHLNIHSLQLYIEELKILLDMLKLDFDIIAISETKIRKGEPPIIDINIPNCQYEDTPTEAKKGGKLIYTSNKIKYKNT